MASYCEACSQAFTGPWKTGLFNKTTRTVTYTGSHQFLDSTSCPMCIELWTLFRWNKRTQEYNRKKKGFLYSLFHSATVKDSFTLRFQVSSTDGKEKQLIVLGLEEKHNFDLSVAHGSPYENLIPGRPPLFDPSADDAFEFINNSIRRCNEDPAHTACRTRTGFMPVRVIDVEAIEPDVRIVETSDLVKIAPYVALSYVWGLGNQHKQLETKLANIGDHRRGIRSQDLPRTIRDAVAVTRRIEGVRYLWVDALCITQDNERDKRDQINQMDEVYRNAYLTISAVSAEGCSSGFLAPRPDSSPYFTIPYRFRNGQIGPVNMTLPKASFARWENGLLREPLHRRGWTFQETMLSRRLLFYALNQPYWRCLSMAAEGGGQPAEEYLRQTGILQILPFKSTDHDGQNGMLELGMSWPNVAQQYSSRVFSNHADKAPALQGVQKLYSTISNDRFILGLRSSAFAEDLLWRLELGAVGRCSNFTSHLPTWSWLSYNGEISYGTQSGDNFTQSEALKWRTLKFDRFGNVTNLPLLIEGKIETVLLRPLIGQDLRKQCWEVDCYGKTEFWNAEKKRYEDDPAKSYQRPIDLHPLGTVTLDDLDIDEFNKARRSNEPDYKAEPLKLECLFLGEQGPEMASVYTTRMVGADRELVTTHKYVLGGDGTPSGASSRPHGRSALGIIVERNKEGKYQRCGVFVGAPTSSFYFKEVKKRAIFLH